MPSVNGPRRCQCCRRVNGCCALADFTWRDAKVIGSLLDVSYYEEDEITDLIVEEQKRVFKSKSKQRLEKKGLSTDQL